MDLPLITPGEGPPPLPGLPYRFRTFRHAPSPDLAPWTAVLTLDGRRIGRVRCPSSTRAIELDIPDDAHFERFARSCLDACASGPDEARPSAEEAMGAVLHLMARLAHAYERVCRAAREGTLFQWRGEPHRYYAIRVPWCMDVERQLQARYGSRLARVIRPARARRSRRVFAGHPGPEDRPVRASLPHARHASGQHARPDRAERG